MTLNEVISLLFNYENIRIGFSDSSVYWILKGVDKILYKTKFNNTHF